MNVTKLMSKKVVTVEMNDPISKVKDIFEETQFHHLLVVEKRKLLGVISDRDLLKSISPNVDTLAATTKDLATLNKRVHQIMTRKPIFLYETATVLDAIEVFNQNKISCIPIVNGEDQPTGILSWRDIMQALVKGK